MRQFKIILLLLVAAFGSCCTVSAQPDDLLVGAIRWDNWTKESPHTRVVSSTNRAPFFQIKLPDGRDITLGGEPNTVDAENAYGRSAGLDYWIFGYYPDTGSFGRSKEAAQRLNRTLETFLTLPTRRGMRFAVQLNQSSPVEDTEHLLNAFVRYITHEDYVRYKDGSALIFVFQIRQWIQALGDEERVRNFFAEFADRLRNNTGITVKLILVSPGALASQTPYISPRGPFAALGTYANPPPCCGTEVPYNSCSKLSREFWRAARQSNIEFIPTVTTGWDWRPILSYPDQLYDRTTTNPSWCTRASDKEWTDVVRDAVSAGRASAEKLGVDGIIIYAWNELSEGGWIVPTKEEGVRRLEAFARALDRSRNVEIDLRFPAGSENIDWPCPPGTHGRAVEASASDEELKLYPGPWAQKACKVR